MKIRITTPACQPHCARKDAVAAALQAVNGKANSFTIRHLFDIAEIAKRAEATLDALPRSQRPGVTLTYTPAGPTAAAYKYGAVSTELKLARTVGGWYLTGVERTTVYPREKERLDIHITGEQADIVTAKALNPFTFDKRLQASALDMLDALNAITSAAMAKVVAGREDDWDRLNFEKPLEMARAVLKQVKGD